MALKSQHWRSWSTDRRQHETPLYLQPADLWGWPFIFYWHASMHFTKRTCILWLKCARSVHFFLSFFLFFHFWGLYNPHSKISKCLKWPLVVLTSCLLNKTKLHCSHVPSAGLRWCCLQVLHQDYYSLLKNISQGLRQSATEICILYFLSCC